MTQKLFPIVILVLVLLPDAWAINPPPDGCYSNSTTAEGCKALQSLTTGVANTGIGWYSLFGTSTGNYNTAVGAGALDLNTADANTAVGVAALLLNTTGTNNTANGVGTLVFNDTGDENTATGAFAMYSNTEGDFNAANGAFALYFNTTGDRNTATGDSALYQNTAGSSNTATGNAALLTNTTGNDNTAVGAGALFSNNADQNTAVGNAALSNNTSGESNSSFGWHALFNNITGKFNTAFGASALANNQTGAGNTAIGTGALFSNIGGIFSGEGNTAVGFDALNQNTTGNNNVSLGETAGLNVTTASHVICIGTAVFGNNVDNSCYIGSIWQQTGGTQAVFVNSDGKLGAQVSSRRFKHDITPMDYSSEVIYRLNPVSFRYNTEIEPSHSLAFGLIAEDVEQVDPDLVTCDKDGKAFSVRYDQVNAMLLNEFLKEHWTVQAQQEEIAALKQELKDQRALIEKVSARIGMGETEPQLVTDTL